MSCGLPGDCIFKPKIPKSFLFVFSWLSAVCDFSQKPWKHCWHSTRKVVLTDSLTIEIRKYKPCQDKAHTCEIFLFVLGQKENKYTYFQAFISRIGFIPYSIPDSIAKSKSIFTFVYLPNVVLYRNFYLVSNKSIWFLDYVEIVG